MKPPERILAQECRHSRTVRAVRLIDVLIDQAHRDWPWTWFVLRLPSGERFFMPAHGSAGPPCPIDHAGYFRERVQPFCEVDPTVRAGICSMAPLVVEPEPPATPIYQVDLRSGTVTSTSHLPVAATVPDAQPQDDR